MNVRERCGASASVPSAAAGRSIAFGDSEEGRGGRAHSEAHGHSGDARDRDGLGCDGERGGGDRQSLRLRHREPQLDFVITSADDGASTLIVVRPDGVIEPRFYVPGRFDGTTAAVPRAPATPTVSTADLIRVRAQGAGHPAGRWLRLVEADRSFAPGFSAEPGDVAEIELDVNLGSNPSNALIVVGRGSADKTYAVGRLGVALDGDDDLDVALGGAATVSLDAGLGAGVSRLTGQGGFGTGEPASRALYLLGDRSSADNTLIGGQAGDYLAGGGGDDVMRGMGGNDSLVDTTASCCGQAGGGSDMLFGGAGNDSIAAENFTRHTVDGGAGFDTRGSRSGSIGCSAWRTRGAASDHRYLQA
jgi:RTX calcium-binding nonapeptide repeat (4 copies)